MNVEINAKKNVDGDEAEIQGATLHEDKHWLGVSVHRRLLVMAAIMECVRRPTLLVNHMEVILGKIGYCFSFQPCLRSYLQECYTWLEDRRRRGARWGRVPRVAREELLACAIMMPQAQSFLDAEWCCRLECYDAAPGGHGRAWAVLPSDIIAEAARWSDAKIGVTDLRSPYGISLDEAGK